MRSFRPSLILVTSLALMPLAGVASAGQGRPRSAPPAQGSTQGSSSSGSSGSSSSSQGSSSDQGRSRTQAQPRQRESAPPQQQPQQQQSQRQEQTRERERQPQQQTERPQSLYERPRPLNERPQPLNDRPQPLNERPQQQEQQNDQSRQGNSRQAIPAPRDRYIDLNRDGRNDNKDSRVLGPQDRRDQERRYDNYGNGSRYDGRYDRYDSRYSNYSPYRYNGPRVVFAPRDSVRFSRPWFSFRPLIRLPFGLTIGIAQTFPSWYRPYIVGRPGYTSPYMPYGGVTFDIEPRDAELWIDGEYIGRVSDYSYNDPPLTLVAGPHYVELRSRYGRPLAFDITVIPGQVIPYQGTLPYYR